MGLGLSPALEARDPRAHFSPRCRSFAAGVLPDVLLVGLNRIPYVLADSGAFQPLEPFIERTGFDLPDFFPSILASWTINGHLIALPRSNARHALFFNKDLFDQAGIPYPAEGWTWLDFLSSAQALTQDFDHDGTRDQFGAGIEPSLIRLAPFIWQAGGHLVDNRANPSTLVLDQPGEIRAERFFVGLQTVYHVVPNAEQEAAEDSESRFMNGRLAMFFNSRRGVPTYRESVAFDWDVGSFPESTGEKIENPQQLAKLAHKLAQAQRADMGLTLACVLTNVCQSGGGSAAIQVGGSALFAKFSRDDELEADRRAVDLLVRAGIDPRGIVNMFQTLMNERRSRPSAVDAWFRANTATP